MPRPGSEIAQRSPASDLAVRLASGETLGAISLARISGEIAELAIPACRAAPDLSCLAPALSAVAAHIRMPFLRARALAEAGEAHFVMGNEAEALRSLDAAHKISSGIEEVRYRLRQRARLVEVEMRAGNRREAQNLLAEMKAELARERGYLDDGGHYLVLAHFAVGEVDAALEAASTIQRPSARIWTLRTAATELRKLGDRQRSDAALAAALELARQLEKLDDRIQALCEVAESEAEVGNREKTLGLIEEARSLARALPKSQSDFVFALVKAGEFGTARELAAMLGEAARLRWIQIETAKDEFRRGDRVSAARRLSKLMEQAEVYHPRLIETVRWDVALGGPDGRC